MRSAPADSLSAPHHRLPHPPDPAAGRPPAPDSAAPPATPAPLQVLLLAPPGRTAQRLRRLLAQPTQFAVQTAHRQDQAQIYLAQGPIDVVLLVSDPDGPADGDLLAALQVQHPRLPVVLVREQEDAACALAALQQGAQDDLVLGDLDRRRLARALRYARARKHTEAAPRPRAKTELGQTRDQLAVILEGVDEGILAIAPGGGVVYANDTAAHLLGCAAPADLLALSLAEIQARFEVYDPAGRRLPVSELPATLAQQGVLQPEMRFRLRVVATGDERWVVVRARPVPDAPGRAPLTIIIFSDITARMESYQRLEQRVEERTHEIERRREVAASLGEILAVLNSDRSLDAILHYIVGQACRLLGTDTGAIYRLEAGQAVLRVQAAQGLDPADMVVGITLGWGATGQAVVQRRPVAVADMAGLVPEAGPARLEAPLTASLRHLVTRYRARLAVPLIVKEEVYGAITLSYRDPRPFSEEEIALAGAFGDQAALAIENARLRVQAGKSAVAAERSRLARDLHDSVTQTLFSTSLIAQALPRLWERDPAEGRRRVEELRQLTRGALAEMRMLLLELRPTSLTEASLGDLLRQLGEAFIGRARLPVALDVTDPSPLPPDVQIALYRIAQESLNNIARHAGAQQVTMRLEDTAARLRLAIADDGRGFDAEAVPAEHLGLKIMRERAAAVGASLTITGQLGQGTQVQVIWPRPVETGSP